MTGEGGEGSPSRFEDLPLADLEAEVMCEVGIWKNFDEIEDALTLDELFMLYEQTTERQTRLMKTVAAAMGADVSGSESTTPFSGRVDDYDGDKNLTYQGGEMVSGGSVLFGYRTKEPSGE
jgi:hypothetical protein